MYRTINQAVDVKTSAERFSGISAPLAPPLSQPSRPSIAAQCRWENGRIQSPDNVPVNCALIAHRLYNYLYNALLLGLVTINLI